MYRAWDHGLARPVAIKEYFPPALVRREADGDVRPVWAEAVELFRRGLTDCVRQWRVLAQCDHPSLGRMLHVFEAHGTAYGVMPWLDGQLLSTWQLEGRLPLDEAALRALIDQLLGGLEALHRAGCVHGGIGPAKVLMRNDAAPVLLGPAPQAGAPTSEGVARDLGALAALARFCITGIQPSAAGAGVPEPLATTVEHLAFDRLAPHYDTRLRNLLTAAPPPRSIASFRRQLLARAVVDPAPAPTGAPSALPTPAAAQVAEPPIEAPAEPSARRAGVGHGGEATPETTELIRRVLASIPDRAQVTAPPRDTSPLPPPPLAPAEPLVAFAPEPMVADSAHRVAPVPPRRHGALWAGALALVVAAGAIGAWRWTTGDAPPRAAADPAAATPVAPTAQAAPTPAPAPQAITPTPLAIEPEPPAAAPTAAAPIVTPPAATATPKVATTPPVAAEPPRRAPAPTRAAAPSPTSPRAACGDRTQFSLYRCMQSQCDRDAWSRHPECVRFRATDSVD